MQCRVVFQTFELVGFFGATYVNTEAQNRRREAVVKEDSAFNLETIETVFPVLKVRERLVEYCKVYQSFLLDYELTLRNSKRMLYEAEKEILLTGFKATKEQEENLKVISNAVKEQKKVLDVGLGRLEKLVKATEISYNRVSGSENGEVFTFEVLRTFIDEKKFLQHFLTDYLRSSKETPDVMKYVDNETVENIDDMMQEFLFEDEKLFYKFWKITKERAFVYVRPRVANEEPGRSVAAVLPPLEEPQGAGPSFVRQTFPCQVTPGCLGFIKVECSEDRHVACVVCNINTCIACMCAVGEAPDDHKCDPNERRSVATLLTTTKACPKCHTRISRISGCPQMMCTSCHTIFDWNTGNECVGGVIHNPHFHKLSTEMQNKIVKERAERGLDTKQWQIDHAVLPANFDALCEPMTTNLFRTAVRGAFQTEPENRGGIQSDLNELYRQLLHFQSQEILDLRNALGRFGEKNVRELRIKNIVGLGNKFVTRVHMLKNPDGLKTQNLVYADMRIPENTDTIYKAQLLRANTFKRYTNENLQACETFLMAGENCLRLLLVSLPSERVEIFDNLVDLFALTLKTLMERSWLESPRQVEKNLYFRIQAAKQLNAPIRVLFANAMPMHDEVNRLSSKLRRDWEASKNKIKMADVRGKRKRKDVKSKEKETEDDSSSQ
jgi:hypothetical protein